MSGSDNGQPLVSVIITTYNCGRYIGQAIDSLLAQTCGNFEIIVVDDGSEDETTQVLARYGKRIKLRKQPHLGISRARNEAFRLCTGKYIAFLDADDRWKPYKLSLQVGILEKMPAIGMLFTNYDVIDEEGDIVAFSNIRNGFPIFREYRFSLESAFRHQTSLAALGIEPPVATAGLIVHHGDVFSHLFLGNFVLPSTEMFRRECLSDELQFNEQYRCATDQDFHLRLARRYQIAFIDCPAADYRNDRRGQISRNKNTAALIDNTIETRKRIIAEEPRFASREKDLIREALGRNYARLAFFYISELEKRKAATAAMRSLRYRPALLRPWLILGMTAVPGPLLKAARPIKQILAAAWLTARRYRICFFILTSLVHPGMDSGFRAAAEGGRPEGAGPSLDVGNRPALPEPMPSACAKSRRY